MKADLVASREEIERFASRVDKSRGAAKREAKVKLVELREEWAHAMKQLDEVENATEATWDDVKISVKKSYRELKESFDGARLWLSDKIEP